jgi:5-methylcytosine-specific restriction endonuclease McrA
MKLRKYTEHQLAEAVKNSTSLAQTLSKLGVAPYGGNYVVLRKALRHFDLDSSHFTGQNWNKGKTIGPKQPLERYLTNELQIQSYKLKKKLLSEGVFKKRCSNCQNTKWLGQPIPLELDHINGDNSDNRLTNLRLLCPNCHALTPNYRGRNISSKLSSVLPD